MPGLSLAAAGAIFCKGRWWLARCWWGFWAVLNGGTCRQRMMSKRWRLGGLGASGLWARPNHCFRTRAAGRRESPGFLFGCPWFIRFQVNAGSAGDLLSDRPSNLRNICGQLGAMAALLHKRKLRRRKKVMAQTRATARCSRAQQARPPLARTGQGSGRGRFSPGAAAWLPGRRPAGPAASGSTGPASAPASPRRPCRHRRECPVRSGPRCCRRPPGRRRPGRRR